MKQVLQWSKALFNKFLSLTCNVFSDLDRKAFKAHVFTDTYLNCIPIK